MNDCRVGSRNPTLRPGAYMIPRLVPESTVTALPQQQPSAAVGLRNSRSSGFDVLVHPEEIVRIVLPL